MGYPILAQFDSAFPKVLRLDSRPRDCGNALPCLRRVHRARRFFHRRLRIFVGTGLQFAAPVEQPPPGRAAAHKLEEIMQRLHDDDQIVLIRNDAPLQCERTIYFRLPQMLERVRARKVQPVRSKTSR
jgi:hypothetical protein